MVMMMIMVMLIMMMVMMIRMMMIMMMMMVMMIMIMMIANLIKQKVVSSYSLDDFFVNLAYFITNVEISVEPLHCSCVNLNIIPYMQKVLVVFWA
jgi:hypothetical protein